MEVLPTGDPEKPLKFITESDDDVEICSEAYNEHLDFEDPNAEVPVSEEGEEITEWQRDGKNRAVVPTDYEDFIRVLTEFAERTPDIIDLIQLNDQMPNLSIAEMAERYRLGRAALKLVINIHKKALYITLPISENAKLTEEDIARLLKDSDNK